MKNRLWDWIEDEEGVATVEYAMLLALVVIASLGAWVGLAAKLRIAIANGTNAISQPLG